MTNVFHFSGGPTSALMTIRYYQPGDIVIFCDTGREHPKTYKFINEFEAAENIPVKRLMYPGGFEAMLKKESVIPNKWKRRCTIELKIKTARRYLRFLKLTKYRQFIGFRSDEKSRVDGYEERWKTVQSLFPLYTDGIDSLQVDYYWKVKPYKLEIPAILKNCDLCFMKGVNAIMAIMTLYPEMAEKWIADEERSKQRKEGKDKKGHQYFKNITYKRMLELSQNTLFKSYDLNEIKPALSCGCSF